MKKAISLLLVLVICLSLCACGGSKSNSSENIEVPTEATEAPTEAPKIIECKIGEAFGTDSVECIITGLKQLTLDEFKMFTHPVGESLQLNPDIIPPYVLPNCQFNGLKGVNGIISIDDSVPSDTSFLCIIYSLQNIGKELVISKRVENGSESDAMQPYGTMAIIDDGGNKYEVPGEGFFSALGVSHDAIEEIMIIDVPNHILEDADKPLKLSVTLPTSNGETAEFIVDVDHSDISDIALYYEKKYQHAVSLMSKYEYIDAAEILMTIPGHKDADALLLECGVKNWASTEILEEHRAEFKTLSGEQLIAMLTANPWRTAMGETWLFFEDGTLDPGRTSHIDGSKVILPWSVTDNIFKYGDPENEVECTIAEVYDGALAMFAEDGRVWGSMWKAE